MSIYKACDILGHVTTELTPALYRCWGRALGLKLAPPAKVVIGGDNRRSTPEFLAALSDGLCDAGVDVVDVGCLPTPMIYYAQHRLQAAACAVVTGSHHAADLNGLKWLIDRQPPSPEEVASLRPLGDPAAAVSPQRPRSTPRKLDISFDYVAWLQEFWVDARHAQFPVVLDAMHGCHAARARRYLHAIFPQCLFSALHDVPQAAFGGGVPDCSRPQSLEQICEAVYHQRAHVGFAFDGDGDRVAVIDNEGMPLTAEETTWVILQSFGPQLRGERFVHDLRLSDRIAEAAREFGAEPLRERSAYSFLRARMRQSDALFGAEAGGRYLFRALEGGEDGLFAACWLIAYLARSRTTLSHVRRECPPVYMTPDLHLALLPEAQQAAIGRLQAAWSGFPQQTIDGLRIDTPWGWALLRGSANEPTLSFRFESSDWRGLDDLVEHCCAALPEVGEILWFQYQSALGTSGSCG